MISAHGNVEGVPLEAKMPDLLWTLGLMQAMPRKPGVVDQSVTDQAKYTFDVDAIGGSVLTWGTDNTGGKAKVNGEYLTATAIFTGLPQNNSDFGTKTVRLKFDGNEVAETKFEVFYDGPAKNHPGGVSTQPNWFHYYKQNAGGGTYGYDPDPNNRSTSIPGGGDSTILIADYVFSTGGWYIETSISTGLLKATGISGINKYYAHFTGVLAHERQHANFEIAAGGVTDPDGDGLSNAFETFISFTDPNDQFSASKDVISLTLSVMGDEEVYAGGPVEERAIKAADTSQDWANPGTNHSP